MTRKQEKEMKSYLYEEVIYVPCIGIAHGLLPSKHRD
jgi:hypothetical protein